MKRDEDGKARTSKDKVIRIPADLHARAKSQAALAGMDLRRWIARAIEEELDYREGAKAP